MNNQQKEAIFNLLQTAEEQNISLAFELINSLGEKVEDLLKPLEKILRANVLLQEFLLSNTEKKENYWKDAYKKLFQLERFIISGLNRYNPIDLQLNEYISYLKNIKNFVWHHSNLSVLNDSFVNLPNLHSLFLEHNQIITIPDSFCQLKLLKTLSINNNNITQLPENIGELQNLEFLYIHNNQLVSLPESIADLPKLKQITLYDNKIKMENLPKNLLTNSKLNFFVAKTIERQINNDQEKD